MRPVAAVDPDSVAAVADHRGPRGVGADEVTLEDQIVGRHVDAFVVVARDHVAGPGRGAADQ